MQQDCSCESSSWSESGGKLSYQAQQGLCLQLSVERILIARKIADGLLKILNLSQQRISVLV